MDALTGWLIMQLGCGSALAYWRLQFYEVVNWRGGRLWAALVPVLVFLITVVSTAQESNLAWLPLVFLAPAGGAVCSC